MKGTRPPMLTIEHTRSRVSFEEAPAPHSVTPSRRGSWFLGRGRSPSRAARVGIEPSGPSLNAIQSDREPLDERARLLALSGLVQPLIVTLEAHSAKAKKKKKKGDHGGTPPPAASQEDHTLGLALLLCFAKLAAASMPVAHHPSKPKTAIQKRAKSVVRAALIHLGARVWCYP
jgi:hypothetical protein